MNLESTFIPILILILATQASARDATKPSQDEVVESIKKLGGSVKFDEKSPGKPVVGVSYYGTRVTDADLVHLKVLTKLQSLSVGSTKVTGDGLKYVKVLTTLSGLNLKLTNVNDAGLAYLKGLKNLQVLYLQFDKITDGGLVHLKGLKNLKYLNLKGTLVTDAGVKKLQSALPKCKILR